MKKKVPLLICKILIWSDKIILSSALPASNNGTLSAVGGMKCGLFFLVTVFGWKGAPQGVVFECLNEGETYLSAASGSSSVPQSAKEDAFFL